MIERYFLYFNQRGTSLLFSILTFAEIGLFLFKMYDDGQYCK